MVVTAHTWHRRLLWVDCTAGALAGVLMLGLSAWLGRLYMLSPNLMRLLGAVNLLYGSCSFLLARRSEKPIRLVTLLVCANAAWSIVCLGLAAHYWNRASAFGVAHLIGEAAFVGGLAALEWRHREKLATAL